MPRTGHVWVSRGDSGENGWVTAPGPHAPPTSRRAAREPRDDSGAPERQADAADFDSSAGTWDDLPDWVGAASPARHRSNYVPRRCRLPALRMRRRSQTARPAPRRRRNRADSSRAPRAGGRRGNPRSAAGDRTAEPPATTGPTVVRCAGPSCSSPTSHRPGTCAPGGRRGSGRGSVSSPLLRC